MGSVICKRADRPLRPMMIQREQSNRYGEAIKTIKGIWFGTKAIISRPYDWIVSKIDEVPLKRLCESSDGVGFGAAISNAPPATATPLEFCQ